MRLPDFWTGLAFAILGISIAYLAQGFHVPAGAASPRLLPTIIGSVMAALGGLIALRGWRSAGDVALPEWISSPRQIALIAFIPVAVIAYGLLAPMVGSIVMAIVIVTVHCLIHGVRPLTAVIVGVVAGIVASVLFSHLLGIPLPEGVVEGMIG
ncbi:tripartite tricarboxylate transporter TctB family protein [Rhizobium sp.]|jgi:putative tricarboxylic transport membrane protein|uniref:tripartite tricarboxylate transporter TctB family protein n=1 Tax=Rhizobium sp. TaxID=391 RepID=UPI0028AD6953